MPNNQLTQDENQREEQRVRQNQEASIQNSLASSSQTATALARNQEHLTNELHSAALYIINSNGAHPKGLHIDRPAALEALRSYTDALVQARGDVSKASVVVQSDDNQVSRREATLSGTEMRDAHVLQAKQEQLLREFAQTSITLQKLGAGALETTIYSGAKADQIHEVGDNWKSSLEQHARYYTQEIEHAGERLRALIDAPTLRSESPLRVDKAGAVVIAANFGDRGSVSAVWRDGAEATINFAVSAAGTITWTANATGPSLPEKPEAVQTTGHQAQLEITKAGEAVENTHQSQITEKVQDGVIQLTGATGTIEAAATGPKKTGGSWKLGGGVTGDATLSPSTEQIRLRSDQERIPRELSRETKIIDFRIETYLHGTRVDIEQEASRRKRQ